jgi:hypothetical protein
MSLSRETILGMMPPKEIVPVPEWGGTITITAMSIVDRLDYERWAGSLGKESTEDIAGLLAFTIVDDSGHRLFTVEDIKTLEKQSAAVILRLNKIALRLNKLGDAEVTAAKGES